MPQTLSHIGKYRVERELGRGAMGVVYKAFDPVVERTVAIKTIRLDVEDAEELANRLRREAKSVGQLEHPNIVTLYDAGESSGLFYLAMQFIQGETLENRIVRQRWFTLKEVQDLFRQICAGLDYAHQRGVIHRDIKPANIMITHEGVVKLTDFGIAKLAGAGTSTHGLIVGTPSYMSPEQALGKPLDGRSDIFSLGSILYELMTGEKAFPGQNTTTVMYKIVHESPTPLRALQPGLDPAVEGIVAKSLAKNPDTRFQTCGELATALELYISKAVAATPKTSVAAEQASATAAPGIPAATPAASGAVTSVATQPATTASGAAPQTTAFPLAWLGAGILGTLLLVIVILLVVQARRPVPAPAPGQPPAAGALETRAPTSGPAPQPTSPPQSSTQPSAPAEKPQPTATEARPSQPEQESKPQRLASARETRTAPPPVPNRVGAVREPPLQSVARPAPVVSPPAPAQPETFDGLILKGDLAFQQSHYREALNAYSKAYKMNPNNREVRRKIAVTLTLLGRPDEAQKYNP